MNNKCSWCGEDIRDGVHIFTKRAAFCSYVCQNKYDIRTAVLKLIGAVIFFAIVIGVVCGIS